MEQIEALITVSEFCEQEVVNNCTSNQLTGYSWWLDRNGNKYKYWHGDRNETAEGFSQIIEIFFLRFFLANIEKSSKGCQCSLTNSCDSKFNDNNLCNCDDRETNTDIGLLTSREQLPVTQLAYGASDHRYSFIHYTLGDLVCFGKRGLYPSEEDGADFMFKASYTGP